VGYRDFDKTDVAEAIQRAVRPAGSGLILPTSEAVEELRILSGDFETSDEDMANVLCLAAIRRGCSVIFDERSGAELIAA
jgi:hypothetical protein